MEEPAACVFAVVMVLQLAADCLESLQVKSEELMLLEVSQFRVMHSIAQHGLIAHCLAVPRFVDEGMKIILVCAMAIFAVLGE